MKSKYTIYSLVILLCVLTGNAWGANEQNTSEGDGAGVASNGSYNSFFGYYTGNKNNGDANTFVGHCAGRENNYGYFNTFIGIYAGWYNIVGSYNNFIGYAAGYVNQGNHNNFFGAEAGRKNTSGKWNIFFGHKAGYSNTTGSNNVLLGYQAGYSNIIGSGNVFLGYQAGYNEKSSNKLYINNSNAVNPLVYGNFSTKIVNINGKLGIGKKAPAYPIHLASGARVTTGGVWTNASSREYKDNIKTLSTQEALNTLEGLNPVKFVYKADRGEQHVGFIAEDVPELVATKDRKGLSSMDIVTVLTKVVQEQQKTIERQQEIISKHAEKIAQLERSFTSKVD